MDRFWESIDQPALLLNEETTRRNINRMASRARAAGVLLRPHFKTHQSAQVGAWFRDEGVQAITVSNVGMAEYFASHGWNDILLALTVNPRQMGRLSCLAGHVRLGVLVESIETVHALAAGLDHTADVWIKIDTGAHRTGIASSDIAGVVSLAQAVEQSANLRLRGILTHAGHTYRAPSPDEVCRRSAESVLQMEAVRSALLAHGLQTIRISVGDTPSASLCADFGAADEIRPGNFVFYDAQQLQLGVCSWQDIAVAVACPVVARHQRREEVVVYGGAVHLSKDTVEVDGKTTYGLVCLPTSSGWGAPLAGAYVSALLQEHGILHLPGALAEQIGIGDLVCILPAHSCLTVTLMQRYRTLTGQRIDTLNCIAQPPAASSA